jgi:gas vesicle protein
MSDRRNGIGLKAFLLGGVIFAGLGLIFAPQSGKETRKKIRKFVDEFWGKTEEFIEESKDKIEDAVNELKK